MLSELSKARTPQGMFGQNANSQEICETCMGLCQAKAHEMIAQLLRFNCLPELRCG